MLNLQLRPLVVRIASSWVENDITQLINQTVEGDIDSGQLDYDRLVSLEKDSAGQISALKANMGALNRLRSSIALEVLAKTKEMTQADLKIPLGNLTGSTLLSGYGPRVKVQVLSVGSVSAWFENEFESTGINQTRHQIILRIVTKVELLIPGGIYTQDVESRITVAETVLMGQIPQNYTYFSQFDTAEEAADAYNDYAAGE